jgi:hypothetical protein
MKNHSDDDANLSFVYSTRRPSRTAAAAAACVSRNCLHGKMSLLFMQKINVIYNASGMGFGWLGEVTLFAPEKFNEPQS